MSVRAWLGLIWFGFVLGPNLGSWSSPAIAADRLLSPAPQGEEGKPLAVGTSSCSARACHGSLLADKDGPIHRDEYTKWLANDKHVQAYRVLFGDRSRTIAKNLGLTAAPTAQRCLVCHQYPKQSNLSGEKLLGVGCEACHGNAQKWLEPHTRRLREEEKVAYGMTAVGDSLALSQTCVGCHVGSKPISGFSHARDVNHDLIAAGHPRLNFEFTAFLANVPPHWNGEKKSRTPKSMARTWAVGQAVTAKAALELLAHRVEQAQPSAKLASWPEFAEYDCFACHHDLQGRSWRQEQASAQRLGSLTWSAWYYTMPRMLAAPDAVNVPDFLVTLDELGRLLTLPDSDSRSVITQAGKAIEQIDTRLLKNLTDVHYDARSLAKAYRSRLENPLSAEANWDGAAQLYLALAALTDDGKQDPKLDPVIRDLLNKLSFPKGQGRSEKYDSPKDFQPKSLRAILEPLGP